MKRRILSREPFTRRTTSGLSITLTAYILLRLDCGHTKKMRKGTEPKGDLTVCKRCRRG